MQHLSVAEIAEKWNMKDAGLGYGKGTGGSE